MRIGVPKEIKVDEYRVGAKRRLRFANTAHK